MLQRQAVLQCGWTMKDAQNGIAGNRDCCRDANRCRCFLSCICGNTNDRLYKFHGDEEVMAGMNSVEKKI